MAYEEELREQEDALDRIRARNEPVGPRACSRTWKTGPASFELRESDFETGITTTRLKAVVAQALDSGGRGDAGHRAPTLQGPTSPSPSVGRWATEVSSAKTYQRHQTLPPADWPDIRRAVAGSPGRRGVPTDRRRRCEALLRLRVPGGVMSNKSGTVPGDLAAQGRRRAARASARRSRPTCSPAPATSPSRSRCRRAATGLQPQLSLVYSTGNGNGPFGLGWDARRSRREPQDVEGRAALRDDAADPTSATCSSCPARRTSSPVAEPAPGVTRYRPRTEGLFARIEHVRDGGRRLLGGAQARTAWSNRYGHAVGRRGRPGRRRGPGRRATGSSRWRLTQTTDPFGNRIGYDYLRDRGDRRATLGPALLQQIRYADYERPGRPAVPGLASTSTTSERPDPFSDYRAGFEIRTRLRCTRIEVRTHAGPGPARRAPTSCGYVDERVAPVNCRRRPAVQRRLAAEPGRDVVGHDGDRRENAAAARVRLHRASRPSSSASSRSTGRRRLPPRSLADPTTSSWSTCSATGCPTSSS